MQCRSKIELDLPVESQSQFQPEDTYLELVVIPIFLPVHLRVEVPQ